MNTLLLPVRLFQSLSLSGRIGLLISLFWLLMALFGNQLAPHNVEDIGGGPMLGGINLARTEQDREQRHQCGDVERRIAERGHRIVRPAKHAQADRHRLGQSGGSGLTR